MADITREELGQIVSLALVNMIQDGRWYTNWRTRDEESQWTKDDFHLIERDQIGKIGFAAIDVVNEIENSVSNLIQSEITKVEERFKRDYVPRQLVVGTYSEDEVKERITKAQEQLLDEVLEMKPPTTVNGAVNAWTYRIEAKRKEIKNER